MDFQNTDYNCGPASMSCAAACLGRLISQGTFAKLAGTHPELGTPPEDVKRGLLAKGFELDEIGEAGTALARVRLIVDLRLGRPVILLCQHWSHWTVAIGMLGDRFVVFDPARYDYRVNTGVTMMTWDKLRRFWRAPKHKRSGDERAYYGIAVASPA